MSIIQNTRIAVPARLQNIQALRAVAALLVIGQHATIIYGKVNPDNYTIWMNAGTGVDIFFAISGLVMVISTLRLTNRSDGWKIFLTRRIERIVPLYWFYTTIKIAAMFAFPLLAKNGPPNFWHILCSYLFIPVFDESGSSEPTPIINPGWSLNYEMLFYCIFAASLWLRIPTLKGITPPLLLLAFLYFFNSPYSEGVPASQSLPAICSFASPIVLEFLIGAIIGTSLLAGFELNKKIAIPLLIFAFVLQMVMPFGVTLIDLHRFIFWGLPGAVVVWCAVSLENQLNFKMPSIILLLGDASYSIYLTHTLTLPVMVVIVKKLMQYFQPIGNELIFVIACYVVAVPIGVIAYKIIEQPINSWFKAKRSA